MKIYIFSKCLIIAIFLLGVGLILISVVQTKSLPAQHQPATSVIEQVESAKTQNDQANLPGSTQSLNLQSVKVTKVIDGDTIEIEGGQRVRYIGIDTPETVHPQKGVECFGREASAKNRELVEGKFVNLEKDVSETDKYGRLLRYIYINDILVNDYLVRQGYAYSSSYPPDIKYQIQFLDAQQDAQQSGMGLWSACASQSASNITQYNKEGCSIKGNISSSQEKIYHIPGQKYYDKTVIDESKGEKWFCTEDEASSSGWRKSKI